MCHCCATQSCRKLAKSFRFVVITNCGHYPNQERPDVFNKAILDFLAETH